MAKQRDKKGRNGAKIGNRYRLVIMNDSTYEEVTSFKLSRMSVYVALSTLFVLLVTITVATVVFTPLRYYIPGYGDLKQRREFIRLKMRTDSLEAAINARDKYLDNIQQVISGDFSKSKLDTTTIKTPKVDNSNY
ncbi:hypothetical protein [Chitinophaga tropicalis]|uniref:Peptidase n=1 Tax=Chitinophaga tropicalis TaxID=2683588 RepID=A0A7K1UB40_9BACT|nr:hypothetical protein [Chitinophaga tropicalis]MVT11498.1 hypothetical protein [Chitinophaga tropicalis]